jgi:sphingomyelin phosphodiesterase acid-like 3
LSSHHQVLIIAHVPPGLFELFEGMAWFYEDFNKKYLEVMEKYSDVIIAQLYGHEHTDSFRVQFDKEGTFFMRFLVPTNLQLFLLCAL